MSTVKNLQGVRNNWRDPGKDQSLQVDESVIVNELLWFLFSPWRTCCASGTTKTAASSTTVSSTTRTKLGSPRCSRTTCSNTSGANSMVCVGPALETQFLELGSLFHHCCFVLVVQNSRTLSRRNRCSSVTSWFPVLTTKSTSTLRTTRRYRLLDTRIF